MLNSEHLKSFLVAPYVNYFSTIKKVLLALHKVMPVKLWSEY